MITSTDRRKAVLHLVLLKVLPALLAVGSLLVLIAWLSGMFIAKVPPGEQNRSRTLEAGVPTVTVQEVEQQYIEESIGTLRAADRTTISSKILARILEIRVSADDYVEQGQVLIVLEQAELQSRLNQTQQQLAAAEQTLAEAQANFNRIEDLKRQNATTQAQLDSARTQLGVATAEVKRAREAVVESTILMSYSQITSPRNGRIVDRLVESGDLAAPGQPLLTLYDPQSLRLEVPVIENLAVKMQVGDEVEVLIDALDRRLQGRIAQRVPHAESATRTFLVKVDLPSTDDLYEGMFGRLRIPAGERRHLCLPESAIVEIGQLQFVDVVGDGQTLQRRLIKTGRRGEGGKVEVLSGLEAGETVVLPVAETSDAETGESVRPAVQESPSP